MADHPDPSGPILDEGATIGPAAATAAAPKRGFSWFDAARWAFPAVMLGNVVLAIGPWFVRLAGIGPVASGFWRMAMAAPCLVLIAKLTGGRFGRMPARLWLALAAAGLFFALDLATWHAGILRTKLANATLFGNVASFFFAAYGFLIARALPGRSQGAALLLAATGMVLLLGRSYELSPEHLVGDLLCLTGGLAYAGYMIAIERARLVLPTWPLLAMVTAIGAVFLLPVAMLIDGRVWPEHWGPLLVLAFGSQVVGQGLIVFGIGSLPPVVVGLSLLVQPIIAATIGWAVYGEALTLPDYAGALAIAIALVLVRRRPAR